MPLFVYPRCAGKAQCAIVRYDWMEDTHDAVHGPCIESWPEAPLQQFLTVRTSCWTDLAYHIVKCCPMLCWGHFVAVMELLCGLACIHDSCMKTGDFIAQCNSAVCNGVRRLPSRALSATVSRRIDAIPPRLLKLLHIRESQVAVFY